MTLADILRDRMAAQTERQPTIGAATGPDYFGSVDPLTEYGGAVEESYNPLEDLAPVGGLRRLLGLGGAAFGTIPAWKLTKNAPSWLQRAFKGGKREVPLQGRTPKRLAPEKVLEPEVVSTPSDDIPGNFLKQLGLPTRLEDAKPGTPFHEALYWQRAMGGSEGPGLVKNPVTYELPETSETPNLMLEKMALQQFAKARAKQSVLGSEGFVHGAPSHTLEKYLKEGIPHGPLSEAGRGLSYVGRLDKPYGYQGSMTAVGGFGPRNKFSQAVEQHAQVGRERTYDPVAYVLKKDIRVLPTTGAEFVGDYHEALPEVRKFWQGRDKASWAELEDLNAATRDKLWNRIPPIEKAISPSAKFAPELIGFEELSKQLASPQQIEGLVYEGSLPKLVKILKSTGRFDLPIYDSSGAMRLAPLNVLKKSRNVAAYELPSSADELAPLLEQLGGSYGSRKLPPVSGGADVPVAPGFAPYLKRQTALMGFSNDLQVLRDSPVRELGFAKSSQQASYAYLTKLRRLVEQKAPDKLKLVDDAIDAVMNDDFANAAMRSEQAVGYLHMDEMAEIRALKELGKRTLKLGKEISGGAPSMFEKLKPQNLPMKLEGPTRFDTLKQLLGIAEGTSPVKVYHGTTKEAAHNILKEGVKLPESGLALAREVARKYEIPYKEFIEKVLPSPSLGYSTEVSRLSTAAPGVASRWAKHFPRGEVLSMMDTYARLYKEAKRLDIPIDAVFEKAERAAKLSGKRFSYGKAADILKLPSEYPVGGRGALMSFETDVRNIPKHVLARAKAVLRRTETAAEAIPEWSESYTDIKVSPRKLKKPRIEKYYNKE